MASSKCAIARRVERGGGSPAVRRSCSGLHTICCAHAVRETRNRLPDATSGPKAGIYLNCKCRVDEVVLLWKKSGFTTDGAIPGAKMEDAPDMPAAMEIPLPRKLAEMLARLVADHEATREKAQWRPP
jgi:hypothetical protein